MPKKRNSQIGPVKFSLSCFNVSLYTVYYNIYVLKKISYASTVTNVTLNVAGINISNILAR